LIYEEIQHGMARESGSNLSFHTIIGWSNFFRCVCEDYLVQNPLFFVRKMVFLSEKLKTINIFVEKIRNFFENSNFWQKHMGTLVKFIHFSNFLGGVHGPCEHPPRKVATCNTPVLGKGEFFYLQKL
jgi:hypothetical protein